MGNFHNMKKSLFFTIDDISSRMYNVTHDDKISHKYWKWKCSSENVEQIISKKINFPGKAGKTESWKQKGKN